MARKLIVEVVGDSSSFERSLGRATRATNTFSRDFSKAERGVLAGSGVFRSLGRTLAFASGGFLAFGGAAAFVRKTIDAAKDAQVTQQQLAQQLANNGESFADYRKQIDETALSLSELTGFDDDELKAALATILRTVPNVSKALRDTATAADLARARHISLANAATLVAKVEAGNTTLLRRQGIQVAKNATVEQALATLRAKVAGQAEAGATEQERFGAALQNSEEIIGGALLPTLNRYLGAGERWLEQMNRSGKLERDVSSAAHDFEEAVRVAADAVKTVDSVTGSFKNTLELLLALKIGSVVAGWAGSFAGVATQEGKASREAGLLRTRLGLLPATVAITIAVEVIFHKKQVDDAVKSIQQRIVDAQRNFKPVQLLAKGESEVANAPGIKQVLGLVGIHNVTPESLLQPLDKSITQTTEKLKAAGRAGLTMGDQIAEAAAKAAHGLAMTAAAAQDVHPINITIAQQNQFFDNRIARILLRGGLGDIQQQIGALQRANGLLETRLKATKDVTRRLNLEDEILQNEAQIRSLRAQASTAAATAASDALQKRKDSFNEFVSNLQLGVTEAQATKPFGDDIRALKALEAGIEQEIREFGRTADLSGQLFDVRQQLAASRASQISGRQFLALGLTETGDQRVPGVRALRRALGNVEDEVAGTFLDTKKTQSLLSRIRKVLSGGLGAVGEDVRSKIQQILGDLNRQLDDSTQKNLTKWRHLSSQAFLAGIPDLTRDQKLLLEQRVAQVGAGGTVPGRSSAAFSSGRDIVVHTTVNLDGQKVAKNTTRHQRKQAGRRADTRRGPWAGRT